MKLSKLIAIVSLTTFGIAGLTGCGEDANQSGGDSANAGTLKVGTTADFAPFEFHSDNQKDYQGFDVELINAIAKDMGRKVEIKDLAFENLIPSLQSKDIDVAISAITINDERQKTVNFSDSYYQSGLSIVVREDESTINSVEDLKGKNIAARVDTTGLAEAQKIENATAKSFETPFDCYNELKNGGVDAVINDKPVNDYTIQKNLVTGLKVLPNSLTTEDYGIMVAKDSGDLQKQINESLKKLRENGEYDKIYSKWFGEKSKESAESSESNQESQAQQ